MAPTCGGRPRKDGRYRDFFDRFSDTIDFARMRKQEEVPMATQDSPSLYERLGGVYSIATVVDDLIDRVMADPRLNANPLVDEAHHKVPPAGFKYLVTEMLCWAAGGPQKYTGKDMESSHRHLRITPGEWDAFMDDLAQTLDKFAVPAAERAEVVAIVESTRHSIVVA
jgi:hemoglobin